MIRSKKVFRVLGWNVFLTLFLVLLVFCAGEVYYRFYVDTTDSFAINKISKRWLERHYSYNNFSVRDNVVYSYKRQPGKRRLTILGDSFTIGHGVKNVDNRFANRIREEFPDMEIHLMAVNGANTKTELGTLHDLKSKGYEFDLVLLVYCLNDIDYLLPQSDSIYKRIGTFNSNLNYLQKESYFLNFLSFRWFAFQDPDFMDYSNFVLDAYNGEEWDTQKEKLRSIKEFTIKENSPFCVVTFPFLQNEIEEYTFSKVHHQLNEFWRGEKVYHLDLLPVLTPHLGEELTVNKYDAHPNEYAHKLTTKAIASFLKGE